MPAVPRYKTYWILWWILRMLYPILFRWKIELLKAGETVLIFPEGTRSVSGHLQKLKQGVAMLAKRSGAVILPVGITGSNQVLTPHSSRFRFFRRVTIRIGKPMSVLANATKEEEGAFLIALHKAIAELLPDECKPVAPPS